MTRAVPGIVVSMPEPAISAGLPSLPVNWARFAGSATLIQGPNDIHAIPDPNPIWNPDTGGWTYPPPDAPASSGGTTGGSGGGDARWSVDSLPDPAGFPNGWYWLGDPSSADGTAGIAAACQHWPPTIAGSGPTWSSFFPYKPSVNSHNSSIVGERIVHHPKGVHFNSGYVEHMWADFGGTQSQPFTWIVVATIMSDRFDGYRHRILDAGRNSDSVGFPRIPASPITDRRINDGLNYRTLLSSSTDITQMTTKTGGRLLQHKIAPGHHPRMFAAVFNGATSKLRVQDPFGKNVSVGAVDPNTGTTPHRYLVMGRENGWIGQGHASNMLVFEIRYWHHALNDTDLDAQYKQLSTTHQFDAYRQL
jgi:hypothetical protein